jgi:hypothetical protein
MIAIAIFTIGFLALGSLVLSSTHNNTSGNIRTQATMLAAESLETFKNMPDITSLAVSGTPVQDPGNPIDENGEPGGIYWRSWTIADPLGNNTSRRISVTVGWNRLGENRSVTMTTITKGKGT